MCEIHFLVEFSGFLRYYFIMVNIRLEGNFVENRYAVILAAGQGTRMKSKLYKVLHPILDRPMIQYVIEALKPTNVEQLVTVVGHGADEVKKAIHDEVDFVMQEEQLGTAHAVMQAEALLENKRGTTIVVCGDTPLITAETYQAIFDYHEEKGAKATILTTKVANPVGYGRIIRDETGHVEKIVEQKDANEAEQRINEINTGTYCFDNEALFAALKQVSNDNAQEEYYLTDVIEIMKNAGEIVTAYVTEDEDEIIGINDRVALATASNLMKRRINEIHLRNGVTLMDIENTYIGPDVTIDSDVTIYPGTILTGETHIGASSIIGPNTEIVDCHIGNNSLIRQSVVTNSKIGSNVNIGPFAHIRPETNIGDEVRVGNFVEVKKSTIDNRSKVSHLSYIGDAILGTNVNVGCGSITVNYDGKNKHETVIEDDSFIGCNTNLIAPVTVKKGSLIAAGSTINEDVPEDALAIARTPQVNKEGYAKKFK